MSDNSAVNKTLFDIRNLLEYIVRQQHFGARAVPEEGASSFEKQEAEVDRCIASIKKTGSPYG